MKKDSGLKKRPIKYLGNSAHFVGNEGGEFVWASYGTFLKVRSLEELIYLFTKFI